jgi:hypothetical protein
MTRVNLGDKVRDRISGVVGVVIARTEWLYGCVRCTVQPQEMKDGKPIDATVVDEPQLEILQRSVIEDVPQWREPEALEPRHATPAGPRHDPSQRPDPVR